MTQPWLFEVEENKQLELTSQIQWKWQLCWRTLYHSENNQPSRWPTSWVHSCSLAQRTEWGRWEMQPALRGHRKAPCWPQHSPHGNGSDVTLLTFHHQRLQDHTQTCSILGESCSQGYKNWQLELNIQDTENLLNVVKTMYNTLYYNFDVPL